MGEKRKNSLASGELYYAFHAIPYAAAPINSLRFMPPQRHGKFTELYDASNSDDFKKCCMQVLFLLLYLKYPHKNNHEEETYILLLYLKLTLGFITVDTSRI